MITLRLQKIKVQPYSWLLVAKQYEAGILRCTVLCDALVNSREWNSESPRCHLNALEHPSSAAYYGDVTSACPLRYSSEVIITDKLLDSPRGDAVICLFRGDCQSRIEDRTDYVPFQELYKELRSLAEKRQG